MDMIVTNRIPIEAQFLYRKGLEKSANGQFAQALQFFRQAVILSPGFAKAHFEMGRCHAQIGGNTEAIGKKSRKEGAPPAFQK